MDRRKFLKVLGFASGAALVPTVAASQNMRWIKGEIEMGRNPDLRPVFDPGVKYGNYIGVTDHMVCENGDPVYDVAMDYIESDMRCFIPRKYRCGVRFNVRGGVKSNDPLFQRTTLSWKYTPEWYESYQELHFGANRGGKTDTMTEVYRQYKELDQCFEPLTEGITPVGRTLARVR